MAAQIRMFGTRVSKTKMLHYYGSARCTTKTSPEGFITTGGTWATLGKSRRESRALWRVIRRGEIPWLS